MTERRTRDGNSGERVDERLSSRDSRSRRERARAPGPAPRAGAQDPKLEDELSSMTENDESDEDTINT